MARQKRLVQYKDKPGSILDAFNDLGEHLGTIMVVALPPILQLDVYKDHIPIVILKQAIPIKWKSRRLPRGNVGLWPDVIVRTPQ